jgi:uncharacterized membrane protein YgdD (TMEM256/DUF423 family)
MPQIHSKTFGLLGAFAGLTGVAAGAFGAHALKAALTPNELIIFKTATEYQMIHGLGLLLIATMSSPWVRRAGIAFALGILLFCGSLYILSLTGSRTLVLITPVGGLCFLAGWAFLSMHYMKLKF